MSDNFDAAIKKRRFNLTPYLFVAPHVLLFIVFFLYPLGYGLYASFTKWNLFGSPTWVGLDNFETFLFNTDSTFHRQFWNGMRNTVLFVVLCVPFQIILPLILAAALNTRVRLFKLFQSIFYMPTLFSITAVTLTWLFIFNRSLGLWNNVLGTDVNWYGQQPFAWMSIVIVTLWWCIGTNMIIYIAALAGVDRALLEASEIDGATGLQRFFFVTLPSIKFQLVYTIVISVISQFNIYGQPLMLTGGGPQESTNVLLMYIRNLAFGTGSPIAGMSSAMAICLGIVIGTVSLVQIKMLRGQDN